jgi:CheY-like chemotaxis protein
MRCHDVLLEITRLPRGARRARAAARMSNPLAVSAPGRVLVADDDDAFRALASEKLRRAGYEVTETHDGRELLDALLAVHPGFFQIVLSDHRMPGFFGLECLARAGSRAPFVIVSGANDPVFHEAAHRFGAAAVVSKEIDLDELVALVDDLAAESTLTGGRLKRPRSDSDG